MSYGLEAARAQARGESVRGRRNREDNPSETNAEAARRKKCESTNSDVSYVRGGLTTTCIRRLQRQYRSELHDVVESPV